MGIAYAKMLQHIHEGAAYVYTYMYVFLEPVVDPTQMHVRLILTPQGFNDKSVGIAYGKRL